MGPDAVQLLSAELNSGGYAEDVFRIDPGCRRDSSAELAMTHLHAEQPEAPHAAVLLHGEFSNRSFWYPKEGSCIASELLNANLEVFLPELRGHGFSPSNRAFNRNNLEQLIEYDLPALQQFLRRRRSEPLYWVAHGINALAILSALYRGNLDSREIAGLALMGVRHPIDVLRQCNLSFWERRRARRQGVLGPEQGVGTHWEREAYALFNDPFELFPESRLPGFRPQFPLLHITLEGPGQQPDAAPDKVLHRWPERRRRHIALKLRSPLRSRMEGENFRLIRGALMIWLKGLHVDHAHLPEAHHGT